MSTHINALICFGLRSRFYLGIYKKNHVLAGIDLTHCSNGSTKVPNLGINLPYVSLGIGHTFQQVNKISKDSILGWNLLRAWVYSWAFAGQRLRDPTSGGGRAAISPPSRHSPRCRVTASRAEARSH
jgi:hypothetical protein